MPAIVPATNKLKASNYYSAIPVPLVHRLLLYKMLSHFANREIGEHNDVVKYYAERWVNKKKKRLYKTKAYLIAF